MGAWYLACELLGLHAALWTWVLSLGGRRRDRLLAWNYALQRRWVDALFLGMRAIYRVRIEVEGVDDLHPDRPFLLFLRHSSLPDVLLPALGWANPRRLALRYVLKVEVCTSPCLDLVGHRLPNAFVRRRSGDPAREIARVLALHEGLGPGEGLVIYPEGTRYSPARRAALLDELEARGDAEALERARSYRQVLPPRLGGPLALLAHRGAEEDLVVCAHSGTEVAWSAHALLDGALLDQVFAVRAWRVPAEEVPRDPEPARAFLEAWWHRVDDWVCSRPQR